MCWTQFKNIGHCSKIWVPLGELFAPPGVPSWLRAWSLRNSTFVLKMQHLK